MLASCKKTWPFQTKGTDQTVHACVECKPDAPLPLAFAKHGKRVIWACDAAKFAKNIAAQFLCKKSLSWLGPNYSNTGSTTKKACYTLKKLYTENKKAAKLYAKLDQGLKLTAKPQSERLYEGKVDLGALSSTSKWSIYSMGITRVVVAKNVYVAEEASIAGKLTVVFTVLSHAVRACGYNRQCTGQPLQCTTQPLQCLETKRSKCVKSFVDAPESQFKSGQFLQMNMSNEHVK